MNARETHILKEQDKRDAQQRKARYNKNYFDKHPDKKERCLQQFDEMKVARVCSELKKHAEDLKDDPERLSTEFILDMSTLKKQIRVFYDSSKYYYAKAKLPKADGIHCVTCGKTFDRPDKRRSYCSQACFSEWYDALVKSWSRIRTQVLKRDGKCRNCGVKLGTITANREVVFEVHHIQPICEGGGEFDPDNCITLCSICHRSKHSETGKRIRFNHSLEEFIRSTSPD